MGQEDNAERRKGGLGIVGKAVVAAVVVLIAACAGVGTYFFVLAPMFEEPEQQNGKETEDARIPATTVVVDFKNLRATIENDEDKTPAPILQYAVALACANPETAQLVEANRQWFESMLVQLHSSRTRDELTDPLARESLLKQAKQEANALLARLQQQENPAIRIIEVMYTAFTVIDL